eukprot:s737_g7.t1
MVQDGARCFKDQINPAINPAINRDPFTSIFQPFRPATFAMNVVCAWLRNDLRVHDNAVLHEAAKLSAQRKVPVLPVYVFDPRYFKRTRYKTLRTGCLRALFLLQSVLALKRMLKRKMGSDLLVKVGKPEKIFPELLSGDSVLLTQQEVTSAELTIDSWVRFGLEKVPSTSNVSPQLTYCWGSTLFHKDDIGFKDGFDDVPEFFSKFLHQLQEVWPAYSDEDWDDSSNDRNVGPDLSRISRLVRPALPDVKLGPVPVAEGLDFDFEPTWKDLPFSEKVIEPLPDKAMMGGEENGLKRLAEYVWHTDFASSYFPERQLIFGDYMASRLGPWLAVGALSPRKVFFECLRLCEENGLADGSRHARHLITELTWRDYFRFYAGKHGMDIYRQGGVKNYKRHWMQDERIFHLWSNGRTGYPLVDACMRELSITGYASNHARLNAASFLAYTMSFDWRRGADWFESHLIDYDVTSNWCNWVRCAGLTEGRLSSFNVVRQSQKFDPQGLYLRRWLPELQKVPMELIHEPWLMTTAELTSYDAASYPPPCVDPSFFEGRYGPRHGWAMIPQSLYKTEKEKNRRRRQVE